MGWSASRAKRTCQRQIEKFGGHGVLVRGTAKRPVAVAILDYSPRQQDLIIAGLRRALIGPFVPGTTDNLPLPPNHQEDLLEFNKKRYRMTAPVQGPRPADDALFYECQVEFDSDI